MKDLPSHLEQDVPLGPLTTLGVGGPARYLARAAAREVGDWLRWAAARDLPVWVLGGGSNVLVADRGFDGLVLQPSQDSLDIEAGPGDAVRLRVGASYLWDDLVRWVVAEGLTGIECLAGIPGHCGAAPIQNIGAYGQEIRETLQAVRVIDRRSGALRTVPAADCGFGYRWSHFKGEWKDRFVVVGLDLVLRRGDLGAVHYAELARHLGLTAGETGAPLEDVHRAVLELRGRKSMLLAEGDPNRRSAGSFFLNPVLSEDDFGALSRRAAAHGVEGGVPRFPAPAGAVKVPAAWLIERAGFERGMTRGRAGLSSRHALALINRGGATAAEIVALAAEIRREVEQIFAIRLQPEPVFVGFEGTIDELLG